MPSITSGVHSRSRRGLPLRPLTRRRPLRQRHRNQTWSVDAAEWPRFCLRRWRRTRRGRLFRVAQRTRRDQRSQDQLHPADDYSVLVAYMNVNALTTVLKKCGDHLTRENLIHQATSLHGERMPMMLPGISINIKPDDYKPFRALRIATFDGTSWTLVGDPISAD